MQRLQLLLHKYWPAEEYPDLAELALANCGTLQKRDRLAEAVAPLPLDKLQLLVIRQLRCAPLPRCSLLRLGRVRIHALMGKLEMKR